MPDPDNFHGSLYFTTTLPYPNANPHIGFALELVQADAIVRFNRLMGRDVFFNTGLDEHGQKVLKAAKENNQEPKEWADNIAKTYKELFKKLNIDNVNFIRTTDENHKKAAQEFWKRCFDNDYIEKDLYKIKYCVGCELEKTDSELVDGKCEIHPNLELEIHEEENYIFKFSEFGERLKKLYSYQKEFVTPESRFNEIKAFIDRGLEDFSISRLKEKMPWGVPVPGDDEHVMYVWFDALVNYISAVGWPDDNKKFEKYWPGVQFAGKDQVRQQAAMWQAMLMAADLPASEKIIIHGFITSGGQKMSKSLGNVIDPIEIIEKYGADALRYYLLRHMNQFEDSDFTISNFEEVYTANLQKGLGNLVSRVMKMVESHGNVPESPKFDKGLDKLKHGDAYEKYFESLRQFDLNTAINEIWSVIGSIDYDIQDKKPYELIKNDPSKAGDILGNILDDLADVCVMLRLFLPDTSEKIQKLIESKKFPEQPLFPVLN